jgi:RNA polymerase sigma-70 factor (ECF subfamily)
MKNRNPTEDALDEQHLVARILARDPTAEREFYDAHVDRVYRLAFRMTGDSALAEEITQDTFLRTFDRLSTFRGESALATWVHSVALSTTLTALRKRKRRRHHETETENPESFHTGTSPDRVGLRMSLSKAIGDLTEKLRVVFLMHDLEGYKHEEIAGMLDIEVGTSKARLSRAREQLRRALA